MIKFLAALVPAAVLAVLPTPASADEPTTTGTPAHGYAQTTVCVVQVGSAAEWRLGDRWRITAAVNAWNRAQDYVQLSQAAVPGCGVLEVREFPSAEHPDWNGYVDWSAAWWEDATYQRLSYDSARLWLNRAVREETTKPYWKGHRMGCFRKSVVAHEIGHALGLEHTTGAESVMSGARDWFKYCGNPSSGDVAALAVLYTPAS